MSVGGTVFHTPHHTYKLWVHGLNPEVDSGAFADVHYLFLKLLMHFGHHLFYTGRVYASILYQLVQCKACHLPTDRVESRKHYGIGGVVYDDLHARYSLQRADITPLAPDDLPLYLIGVYLEYRYRMLYGGLGG